MLRGASFHEEAPRSKNLLRMFRDLERVGKEATELVAKKPKLRMSREAGTSSKHTVGSTVCW